MKASESLYFIVTTMDGVPVLNTQWSIMQLQDTTSCRYHAKTRTFATKTRHHSRALTKDQFFRAQKEWKLNGSISMETLGWKGD